MDPFDIVESTMATAWYQWLGNLGLFVSGDAQIADDDWEGWVKHVRRRAVEGEVRIVAITGKTAPNNAHRKSIFAAFGDNRVRLAVLTASPFARGVIRLFQLRPGVEARGFRLGEYQAALAFVGAGEKEAALAAGTLERLVARCNRAQAQAS